VRSVRSVSEWPLKAAIFTNSLYRQLAVPLHVTAKLALPIAVATVTMFALWTLGFFNRHPPARAAQTAVRAVRVAAARPRSCNKETSRLVARPTSIESSE